MERFRDESPGDCGSWVKNAITGKIFGHVIAGSPKTGLVLLMPASRLFAAALGALSACDVGELIGFKADVEAVSAEDVIPRPQPPSPYQYQPLANSSGEIRLIKIHRAQESQESGPNGGILLEISLFHTPLDQTSPYLAVLYIWGDPTPTHKLLVNGAPLWVSSSTFRALYTTHCSVQKTKTKLYQAGEDVALWIDALCINQLDIAERNVQVLQMGRIYRQARGVIGYIGAPPAGMGLEDGFLALARFGNAPVTKPPQGVPADQSDPRFQAWYRGYQIQKGSEPPEDFGEALTGLFLSNWFVRCWVIQEMALSRETVCLYGYGQEAKSWSLSTMAMLKAASDDDVIPRPPPSFLASGVDVTSDHSALKIWRSPTETPPRSGEGIYASPTHDEGEPSGQSKFDKHGKTGGRPSRETRLSQDPAVQNCTNDVPKEDVDASLTAFLSRWILPTSPEDKERQVLGETHPDTIWSMADLAVTYHAQGRYSEAEPIMSKVLELRRQVLGETHPDTLDSMNNLALVLDSQRKYEEAEKLQVQVMETRKTKLGVNHPSTLTSMNNLASTYMNQGRWLEAEKLEVQVMETRKAKLGADMPSTLTSMANLASTYKNQGRWEEAEKLEVQVIETRKTKLGADHPDTLTSMANLGSTLWNQGRWEEAEKLFVQVMETSKTKLGVDHPDTLTSMGNLAVTWEGQGRRADALALMRDCAQAQQRVLRAEHPDTLSSLATVTKWSS